MRVFISTLFLALGAAAQSTTEVFGRVSIPKVLVEAGSPHPLRDVRLDLSNHIDRQVTYPSADGAFVFRDVFAEGSYILHVYHPKYQFEPITIDILESTKIKAFLTDPLHTRGTKLKYPLDLGPTAVIDYFEEREEFNVLSILKQPMMLMMGVMCLLMFVMSKLQPDMNDDSVKKMKEELKDDDSFSGMLLKKMYGGE